MDTCIPSHNTGTTRGPLEILLLITLELLYPWASPNSPIPIDAVAVLAGMSYFPRKSLLVFLNIYSISCTAVYLVPGT